MDGTIGQPIQIKKESIMFYIPATIGIEGREGEGRLKPT